MVTLERMITRINIEMTGDTKRYLVSAKQGDRATRYVIANLFNDGTAYTIPEGARVAFNVEKPDGKHVYNTCSYSGSEVVIELTSQTLAAVGTAYCDIEVRTSDNTQLITSASFTIEIEKSQRSDSAIISSNEFTELENRIKEHIKNINDTETEVEKAETERVRAEKIRNQNEQTRIEQETSRERNISQAIRNAEEETQKANQAASEANEAAENIKNLADNGEFTGSIEIGTVTTGNPGTKASVTNRGTGKDAILDITIPQGKTGRIENLETATIKFEKQTERENINDDDVVSILFGKIKKWFSDLKEVAFSGSYKDLSDKPLSLKNPNALKFTGAETESYDGSEAKYIAIPSGVNNLLATTSGFWLDATQGKVLDDKIKRLNELNKFNDYECVTPSELPFTNILTISPEEKGAVSQKKYAILQDSVVGILDDMPWPLRNTISVVYRDVLYRSSSHILVTLTEAFPVLGRVWTAFYNSGTWAGWKCNQGITLFQGDIYTTGTYQMLDVLTNYPRVEMKGIALVNGVTPFKFELIQQNAVFEQGQVWNLSVPAWPGLMPYMLFTISGDTITVTQTGRIELETGNIDTTVYHTQMHVTHIIGYWD